VDGVWTVDPANPERRADPDTGLELSVARVPYLSDLHLGLYSVLDENGSTARFVFRGASGESVAVCGDFDNWDPFIHEMSETSPGEYRLDLPLAPGRHYYTFVYRGRELTDSLNPARATSRDGKAVSVLVVDY
jgi:1,4-alpha-glucan branching enzyme